MEMNMKPLDKAVIAHSVGVAEFMAEWATTHRTKYCFNPCHCYVLGLLHDIGKLCPNDTPDGKGRYKGHARKGGELLEEMGFYKYREVMHHGHPEEKYYSVLLSILNMADLSVNGKGERVSVNDRLAGIRKRYGEDSDEYRRAATIVRHLKEERFLSDDGQVL